MDSVSSKFRWLSFLDKTTFFSKKGGDSGEIKQNKTKLFQHNLSNGSKDSLLIHFAQKLSHLLGWPWYQDQTFSF